MLVGLSILFYVLVIGEYEDRSITGTDGSVEPDPGSGNLPFILYSSHHSSLEARSPAEAIAGSRPNL